LEILIEAGPATMAINGYSSFAVKQLYNRTAALLPLVKGMDKRKLYTSLWGQWKSAQASNETKVIKS
jgi:hypothetical protein